MTPSLERLLESVARSAQKVDAALAEGRLEFSPLLHPWPYDRLVALYEEEIERLRADPAAYIVAFAENDRDEFIDRVSALRLEPVKRDPVDDLAIRRGLPYTGRDQVGSAAYALRQFWRWAERRDRSKPYFAYVHLLDVHDRTPVSSDLGGPDLVKEEVDRALVRVTYVEGQAAGVRAGDLAYDLAVHQSDHWIGDLLRRMQAAGELENTIVVVTADHGHDAGFPPRPGVNIMDHVDEMYHIPLIAVGPGIRPGFDDRLCSAVDLAPTVMAWAGLPAPTGVRGRSFADRSAAPRDWVLFEHLGSGPCDFSALPIRLSIRSATTKVTCLVPPITSSRDGSLVGLYDLEKDPYEYANLIYDSPKPPDTEALLTAAEERVGEIVRQLMELVRQAQEGE